MQAPPEKHAFVAGLNPPGSKLNDALLVVDVDPESSTYGQRLGEVKLPNFGDELHPLWLECLQLGALSLCAAPARRTSLPGRAGYPLLTYSHHRYKARPAETADRQSHRAEEVFARTNYSRPHTIHCGPEAIYVSALGDPNGDGPGGIFMLDCETFDVLGQWEVDRGDQFLHYDFWWHLGFDTLLSSEWGTPNMIENGVQPDLLLGGKYGHQMHVWDLRRGDTFRRSI
jgi:selenium-binding protein 1